MMSDTNENLEYLDMLRVMAISGVIFTHVSSSVLSSSKPLTSFAWWVGNVSVSAARWCVPVFVMISGALHLDPARSVTAISFWKKRMNRILVPLVFWTVFYLGFRSLFGKLLFTDVLRDIVFGTPFYHLWFLYMIAGLYFVTPFLRTYVKWASSKEKTWLIMSIFILANCYYSLNSLFLNNHPMIFTLFIPFLAYYICGYQLRLVNMYKLSCKYFVPLIVACVLSISIGTAVLIEIFDLSECRFLYNYFSVPVVIMSGIVFWGVQSLSNSSQAINHVIRKLIARINPTIFGIYLLHAAVLHIAIQVIGQETINRHSFIATLVLTILILFVCHLIVSCIMKISYLRRIVV